jgi:hypothetical protein
MTTEFDVFSWRLELTQALVETLYCEDCSRPGEDNENACVEAVQDPAVRTVLDRIDPDALAKCLGEYGAWDEVELADHDRNLLRITWIVAGDWREEQHGDKQ